MPYQTSPCLGIRWPVVGVAGSLNTLVAVPLTSVVVDCAISAALSGCTEASSCDVLEGECEPDTELGPMSLKVIGFSSEMCDQGSSTGAFGGSGGSGGGSRNGTISGRFPSELVRNRHSISLPICEKLSMIIEPLLTGLIVM